MENILQEFMKNLASFLKSGDARATYSKQGLLSADDKKLIDLFSCGMVVSLRNGGVVTNSLPCNLNVGDKIMIRPKDSLTDTQQTGGFLIQGEDGQGQIKRADFNTAINITADNVHSLGLGLNSPGTKECYLIARHNF